MVDVTGSLHARMINGAVEFNVEDAFVLAVVTMFQTNRSVQVQRVILMFFLRDYRPFELVTKLALEELEEVLTSERALRIRKEIFFGVYTEDHFVSWMRGSVHLIYL